MRNRPFIYYDQLSIVWVIYRATRDGVESLGDVLEILKREKNLNEDNSLSSDEKNYNPANNNNNIESTAT